MINKKICLYFVMSNLAMIIFNCQGQEKLKGQKALRIFCPREQHVSKSDMKVTVSYINSSNDTLVLPFSYMKSRNFQSFVFPDHQIEGGIDTDYYLPDTNENNKCSMKDILEAEYLKTILPHDTLVVDFSLIDLGYQMVIDKPAKDEKYNFYIDLQIPNAFTNICSQMWTGSVKSNLCSIHIE